MELTVDHYDDPSVINNLSPDVREGLSKVASDLSGRLHALPDTDFALILWKQGDHLEKLRKFACADAGNAALSATALLQNEKRLPKEAVKVAAANIVDALEDFSVPVPERLAKLAGAGTDTNVVFLEGRVHRPMRKSASFDADRSYRRVTSFFFDNEPFLTGWEKRELAKTASSLVEKAGRTLPSKLEKYAADSYAQDLVSAIAMRQAMCVAEDEREASFQKAASSAELYRQLLSYQGDIGPEKFASLLEQVDKKTGLEGSVPDAVYSTFGKTAQQDELLFNDGTNRITESQLEWFANHGYPLIEEKLGADLAEGMRKDPVTIFNSLPRPQKSIISRLASQMRGEAGVTP